MLIVNNEILGGADDVPIHVPARKLGRVGLWQLSWWRILTAAVVQHEHRGVSDPEQAWILRELITYLLDERSGAGEFDDMGPSWMTVRDGARHNTLTKRQNEVADIARRWEHFIHYVALGLTQELGEEVVPTGVKQPLQQRLDATVDELVDHGRLLMTLRVPHTVGPMAVCADLRTRMVTTSVVIKASGHATPVARVRWILRQIDDAPGDLRVEARFERTGRTTSALLAGVRDDPQALLLPDDSKRPPREFQLSLSRPMGIKRSNKAGSFIAETRRQAVDFYRELVQDLLPYQPKAPRIRETAPSSEVATATRAATQAGLETDEPEPVETQTAAGHWQPTSSAAQPPAPAPDAGGEDAGQGG